MSKEESYQEALNKGITQPILIWFEPSDRTALSLLEQRAKHIEPVFDDLVLDAYLIHNGTEEILPSSIATAKYGLVHGRHHSYEMTRIARQHLMELSQRFRQQWEEIQQIHLEGVNDLLREAIRQETQKQQFVDAEYADVYEINPPVYKRYLFDMLAMEAIYDPSIDEEYRIEYVWRTYRFKSFGHVMIAIMMDYEKIQDLTFPRR